MRITWYSTVAMFILVLAAPSLLAQDFLKQLEEKLFQKQQDANNEGGDAATEEATDEQPIRFPDVQEPETLPTPRSMERSESPDDMTSGEQSETSQLPTPPRDSLRGTKNPPKVQDKVKKPSQLPASPFPAKPLSPTRSSSARPSGGQQESNAGGGGFLGLTVESSPGGGFGLIVVEVAPNSPAWKSGFRNGDRVVGVAGQAVSTVDSFADQLSKYSAGQAVKFLVDRRGRNANLTAILQDRVVAGQIHGNRPGTAIELAPPGAQQNQYPASGRAFLGLNVADLSDAFRRQFAIPAYRGASVTGVVAGSPAETAGLKPGDCIVEMDGAPIQHADGVWEILQRSRPGQLISVTYYRGVQLTTASVPLGLDDAAPPNQVARQPILSEMLTPEYVESLHGELNRVNDELAQTQARLSQLEARLQQIEKKR